MGLDIYFYKTKNSKSNNIDDVYNDDSKNNEKRFRNCFNKHYSKLKKSSENTDNYIDSKNYVKAYNKFIEDIKSYFGGYFDYERISKKVFDLDGLKEWFEHTYIRLNEDIYYRKVNFVYKFFKDNCEFVDECCWVSKDVVHKLIDNCTEVLDNNELAYTKLPTQSGFFFGCTDYGNYYFDDVEQVKKDFTKLLENWKDDERVYAVFSW